MATFRILKDKDYTVMSNHHLKNKNLSLKAKGLLSYMLSLPEDWDYSLAGLVAVCKENKDAIRSALNELKASNYLKIEPTRSEMGQFEYEYLIYEKPFEIPLKMQNQPNMGFPDTVERNTDNPPQINTNKQSTKELIDIEDKEDKTHDNEQKHNILTNELINLGYIAEDDITSFSYDKLFKQYLSEGYTYKALYTSIHYIAPRVIARNFIDENGEPIKDKYYYLKVSIDLNYLRLNSRSEGLYSEEDELMNRGKER